MKRLAFLALAVATLLLASAWSDGSIHADTDHPIRDPATGMMVATRLNPQPPAPTAPPVLWTTESQNGRCVGLIAAFEYWNPGWDVNRMSAIAYRESRCQPGASNSCCTGILQIHRIWIPKAAICGVFSRADLLDPWKSVCVASIIFREQGMQAWSTS